MTVLSKAYRKQLERVTGLARELAEGACRAALENLAVHEREYRAHMDVAQRQLRNRLRARGRALGDGRDPRSGVQAIKRLSEHAAYEHWHRLLFTRFLTENGLLITDEANGSVPITLAECEELASELGARDGFDLACRFASQTLPGVFRRDDPVLELTLAVNDQVELRKLLAGLPTECFTADDGLGWTYQFWQAKRKEEVNASGKKIGADELSPVTQLFTEDYMVEFLLHNTLGAWWAGKLAAGEPETFALSRCATEAEARQAAGLAERGGLPAITWTYLRFVQDEATQTWRPAAGVFEGWPREAAAVTVLDPCMGSGHFLVFALPLLARLRMEEEGLSASAAVVAVLRDNLHGLELDERCTQIAAFNVALTAWKLGGHQALPGLHLACSGLAPSATEGEWVALAGEDDRLRRGMARLYGLFKDAPVLGSLINPRAQRGDLTEASFEELAPLLTRAVSAEVAGEERHEQAVVAQGLAKAARILAAQFVLVITNVPYLSRGKQDDALREYCDHLHQTSKTDLATCFVDRCPGLCNYAGSLALVTPQNWLFQDSYTRFRQSMLTNVRWTFLAKLGAGAFEGIGGQVVGVALVVLGNVRPLLSGSIGCMDTSDTKIAHRKAKALIAGTIRSIDQVQQLQNPDHRVLFDLGFNEVGPGITLEHYAEFANGMQTGDYARYGLCFWELARVTSDWEFFQTTVKGSSHYDGLHKIVLWEHGEGQMASSPNVTVRGRAAWGKRGVAVSAMGDLAVCLYAGHLFDDNVVVITCKDANWLPAVWTFCSSAAYPPAVRRIDPALKVRSPLVKVPFDALHWKSEAETKYPHGLPRPQSDDPSQWLFGGHPNGSQQSLHVAVARLLGYRWPRQTGSVFQDCAEVGPDGLEVYEDVDGLVCLPPLNREQPAADRLRQLLANSHGSLDERALLARCGPNGSRSNNIEDWLRDEFFEQHCKLFHDRPFIWHLWDGRLDGFHVLVNYHRLDYATLQKLSYSYLGDWVRKQADDVNTGTPGAIERLEAARKLQAKLSSILEGQAPLDIFVRWKSISEQSIGWQPELRDGLRQNIRPFLLAGDVGRRGAGLFRSVPLKLSEKDRGIEQYRSMDEYPWFWCEDEPGTDPVGGKEYVGTRWNNVHLTLERKRQARSS